MTTNKNGLISALFVVWIMFLTIEVIASNNLVDLSYLIFVIVSYIKLMNIKKNAKE